MHRLNVTEMAAFHPSTALLVTLKWKITMPVGLIASFSALPKQHGKQPQCKSSYPFRVGPVRSPNSFIQEMLLSLQQMLVFGLIVSWPYVICLRPATWCWLYFYLEFIDWFPHPLGSYNSNCCLDFMLASSSRDQVSIYFRCIHMILFSLTVTFLF